MTVSLKHKFQSAKADSGDASIVRPSNWNDEHDLTLAGSRLIGRYSGSAGSAQEIALGNSLSMAGGTMDTVRRAESVKTADYAATAADNLSYITMNKATPGQVSLPALAGANNEVYIIRNIAADNVTIKANAAELIEGFNTYTLAKGETAFIWPAAANASWRATKSSNAITQVVSDLADARARIVVLEAKQGIKHATPVVNPNTAAVLFAGIPAGVKRIIAYASNVATSAPSTPLVRLGSGGAVATSGYDTQVAEMTTTTISSQPDTTGLLATRPTAASSFTIMVAVFERLSPTSNIWFGRMQSRYSSNGHSLSVTSVTLAGEPDRLQFSTGAGTALLNGQFNISWEF